MSHCHFSPPILFTPCFFRRFHARASPSLSMRRRRLYFFRATPCSPPPDFHAASPLLFLRRFSSAAAFAIFSPRYARCRWRCFRRWLSMLAPPLLFACRQRHAALMITPFRRDAAAGIFTPLRRHYAFAAARRLPLLPRYFADTPPQAFCRGAAAAFAYAAGAASIRFLPQPEPPLSRGHLYEFLRHFLLCCHSPNAACTASLHANAAEPL